MRANTVAAYTLGCKVNQYETEAILEQFLAQGWTVVDFSEPADVYLVNTCTVTGMGDRKSRQMMRRAKHSNPNAALVVTGCYAQTAPDEVLSVPEVDLVIGGDRRSQFFALTEEFLQNKVRRALVGDIAAVKEFEDLSVTHYENRTRAFMKVQEGCNQFCSYCIIPYARGRIRSRSVESAVSEAKRLAAHGFCEIVLVGINLSAYGKENGKTSLLELIYALCEVEGIQRIRLGSLEPMIFTEEFTAALSRLPKLCHHFHLSLQSGCDATLRRMNRNYTTAEYAEVVSRIRRVMPDSAIATDIMVGFPQESEEEFETTCKFAEDICLADAHIFKYSVRKGTRAAEMEGQIDPQKKEERSHRLTKICERSHKAFLQQAVGTVCEVLFEQYHHHKDGFYEGKTGNYLTVAVQGDQSLEGKICKVAVKEEKNGTLYGELLNEAGGETA